MATKITVKNVALQRALERATSVISSQPDKPALKYAKLTYNAADRVCILTSAESEGKSEVECIMHTAVADIMSDDFSFMVEPKVVLQALAVIKAEEVMLEVPNNEGDKVTLKGGKVRNLNVNAVPVSEFPKYPRPNSGTIFKINSTTLKRMISSVQSAINSKDARVALTAVYFEYFRGKLYVAGTESNFSLFSSRDVSLGDTDFKLLIPYSAIGPIIRCLPDGEEVEVQYHFRDKNDPETATDMFFKTPQFMLRVKCIDKQYQYPPILDVLVPGGAKSYDEDKVHCIFKMSKDVFAENIGIASAVAEEKEKRITLIFGTTDQDHGSLIISAQSEKGSVDIDPIACENLKGSANFEMILNGNYLAKVLAAITTPELVVRYTEGLPICILSDGSSEIQVGSIICRIQKEEPEDEEETGSEEEEPVEVEA